ncbi:MAG: gamma-glutamylcyclotransferase [Peptococcaceae bacterium]|nr:gamma-glutamylcyclotransferase [Peptococcaceae bacterium]
MEINRVFVYGTLMSGMGNHHLIKPFLKGMRPGKTEGILYDLPYGYPAVIPGKGIVHGEIMELRDIGKSLQVLDRLEGYREGCAGNPYNRVVQVVETVDGAKMPAYLYIWGMPEEIEEQGAIVPGGDWRRLP